MPPFGSSLAFNGKYLCTEQDLHVGHEDATSDLLH